MSGRKRDPDSKDNGPEELEEINESETGGRKDGGTPDYEEAMTPNYDQKDFDNSKTSW